jgi:hypothetical protein
MTQERVEGAPSNRKVEQQEAGGGTSESPGP